MLAFRGTLAHTPGAMGELQLLEDHAIIVDDRGIIAAMGPGAEVEDLACRFGVPRANIQSLTPLQLCVPGFIDCHVHAPQVCAVQN